MKRKTFELKNLLVRFGPHQDFLQLGDSIEGEEGHPTITFEKVEGSNPVVIGRVRVTDPGIGRSLRKAYHNSEPVGLALQVGQTPYFIETVLVIEQDRIGGKSDSYIIDFGQSSIHASDFGDSPPMT
jgi:hypothetical protein